MDIKQYKREWYLKNKERLNPIQKEYNKQNKDEIKKYQKEYYQNNKEKIRMIQKNWNKNNKDKIKKWVNNWFKTNKEKISENKKKNYNPYKTSARGLAFQKITIPKGTICMECNKELAIHRHHEDYNKPLEVMLVCQKCHTQLDKIKMDRDKITITERHLNPIPII